MNVSTPLIHLFARTLTLHGEADGQGDLGAAGHLTLVHARVPEGHGVDLQRPLVTLRRVHHLQEARQEGQD